MTLPERRNRLASKMAELGFKPAPGQAEGNHGGGVVDSQTAEGIYYNIGQGTDDFQLLIIGPMMKRPKEYAELFPDYFVTDCRFLEPHGPPLERQKVLDKGMVSLLFSKMPDALSSKLRRAMKDLNTIKKAVN